MSVINQMLNGLERRGIQSGTDQVRTVHHEQGSIKSFWWVGLFSVCTLLVVLFGLNRIKTNAPVSAAREIRMQVSGTDVPAVHLPAFQLSYELSFIPAEPEPESARKPPAVKSGRDKITLQPVLPQPVALAKPDVATVPDELKKISLAQQLDTQYRKARESQRLGRTREAILGFEAVLQLDAGHTAARSSLVAALLEGGRVAEAEAVLQSGLKAQPENTRLSMLLARVQVQRNDLDAGIATLEKFLPYAAKLPEYQGFYAALLQRSNRHGEAAQQYQQALSGAPENAIWLMGYGISLQALSRPEEAKKAYQHALDGKKLSPELQAFVQQKLKEL